MTLPTMLDLARMIDSETRLSRILEVMRGYYPVFQRVTFGQIHPGEAFVFIAGKSVYWTKWDESGTAIMEGRARRRVVPPGYRVYRIVSSEPFQFPPVKWVEA